MSSTPVRSDQQRRRLSALIALAVLLLGIVAWLVFVQAQRSREIDAEAAIARGLEFLKQGRPNEALHAVSRVREEGRARAEILAVRGMALASLNQAEDARRSLE